MKRTTTVLVTAIAALIVLPLGVAPASAADEEINNPPGITSEATEAELQELLDYWTPERLAESEPMELEEAAAEPIEHPAPLSGAAAPKLGFDANDEPIERAPGPNVGRLSFTHPDTGRPTHCTATVVDTPGGSTLITAAHCLHNGKNGDWYKDMVFTPAFSQTYIALMPGNTPAFNVSAPYGTFPVTGKRVHSEWVRIGVRGSETVADNVYDVGFVDVGPNSLGQSIQSVVGGSEVRFGLSGAGYFANSYGYPSRKLPIDPMPESLKDRSFAMDLDSCHQRTKRTSFEDYPFMAMTGCADDYGTGISGGPWIAYETSNASDLGVVMTVSSFHKNVLLTPHWAGIYLTQTHKRIMLNSPINYDFVRE